MARSCRRFSVPNYFGMMSYHWNAGKTHQCKHSNYLKFTHSYQHEFMVIIISKDIFSIFPLTVNHIGGVMVSMLSSSVVDCGFEPRLSQTKDNKIGICYFTTKETTLRRKSKYRLARNKDNVSEWSNMSICGLLFQ